MDITEFIEVISLVISSFSLYGLTAQKISRYLTECTAYVHYS